MSNEKPIIFNDQMVRAILEGRKTQTRRIAKPPKGFDWVDESLGTVANKNDDMWPVYELEEVSNPFGQAGDYLWVREAHSIVPRTAYAHSEGVNQMMSPLNSHDAAIYRADWERSPPSRWKPSIHMPRWAARINLQIKKIRVERLQNISEADAKSEGAPCCTWDGEAFYEDSIHDSFKCGFAGLWASIYGAESWDKNPWVHVIEFERETD